MNERFKEEAIKTLVRLLEKSRYHTVGRLAARAYVTAEPVGFANRMQGEEKTLVCGESWGKHWECAWFHFTGVVGSECDRKNTFLSIDLSGEGLVCDREGRAIQGIVTPLSTYDRSLGEPGKKYIPIDALVDENGVIEAWIDAGCNDLFGNYIDDGKLREADVVVRHEGKSKLYLDVNYLWNLCMHMNDESYHHKIYNSLYGIAMLLEQEEISDRAIDEAILQLKPYISVDTRCEEDFLLAAIGHAHIDLAWLWPIRETKRKVARTFATVLQMIERYPDYVFGASQPQMFEWLKEDYPELYLRVKEMVKQGRIECQGGMWVEADTNISGGEALIRQFLYGKRFFKEAFDQDMKMLWLPDVFGYSGALPQIMKHTDVDYFMTIKLSWSEHNTFPYHTFNWEGIDGSQVLAHMPPEGTYNSAAMPESFKKSVDEYKNKEVSNEALLVYGIGDGGGGPSESHLESLERAKHSVAVPRVIQQSGIDFFERLKGNEAHYPRWCGELYLEKHQGTYTTHAKSKKYNRQMELALRECEFACTLAHQAVDFPYPKEIIEAIWKEVLLYQFHDILPGSSIQRVYVESLARYAYLYEQVTAITQAAYEAVSSHIDCADMKQPVVYFNSLNWIRTQWIGEGEQLRAIEIPPMGWTVYDAQVDVPVVQIEKGMLSIDTGWTLENEKVKVIFAEDGTIASYYDKTKMRELTDGKRGLNQFVLYNDQGDCWDMPFNYREGKVQKAKLSKVEAYESQLAIGIIQYYEVGEASKIKVKVSLEHGGKMLKFDVEVDWQEMRKMLRTQFPLQLNTKQANCEIQFGHIERPTHLNTTWDQAKIEIAAHKWVDLSESNYGVALINDCKYGYNVWHNVIDLDILRSPQYPSEEEKGIHTLRYALLPHEGNLAQSDVIKEGYFFNVPSQQIVAQRHGAGVLPQNHSLIEVFQDNIIIEAVKLAENGEGYIVRLYEAKGTRTLAELKIPAASKVISSNGMEVDGEPLHLEKGMLTLSFGAFEIKTLRIQ
ncbi:MAG: alpha-mannosidase [Cellulosilyticaceae bacterium]